MSKKHQQYTLCNQVNYSPLAVGLAFESRLGFLRVNCEFLMSSNSGILPVTIVRENLLSLSAQLSRQIQSNINSTLHVHVIVFF